jgi:methyltransferase OMS1
MSQRALAILGGGLTFVLGVAASVAMVPPKAATGSCCGITEDERFRIYDGKAKEFDDHIDKVERSFSVDMVSRRKSLMRHARGEVVEVCAGGGRNNEFFIPSQLTSLTLVDFAPKALELGVGRPLGAAYPSSPPTPSIIPRVLVADAHALPLADASFDCAVDTFGLCSLKDPQKALKEMARIVKPEGKILLLEHGRSSWCGPLNWLLDRGANGHLKQWGCQWNNDVEALVSSTLSPSCEIVSVKHHHFGTTSEIILRKLR